MKIYCGRNRLGKYKASRELDKISKFDDITETDLSVVHNDKVYIIETYYGFDYRERRARNIKKVEGVYHSILAAKKSSLWQNTEELVSEDPEHYHVTEKSISTDVCGNPFTYGDVVKGDFNMTIIPVKVV